MKTTTRNLSEESNIIRITGLLWSGHKCTHDYPLEGREVNTLHDAKAIAGDFESVTSARVIRVQRAIVETIETRKITYRDELHRDMASLANGSA